MATATQLNDFITYLNAQANIITIDGVVYGEPYVWGGKHVHLTPSNYQTIIHDKEKNTGGYPNGVSYEDAAKAYCKKLFDAGMTDLYAYDCSSLGMYDLYSVQHIYSGWLSANQMMNRCKLYTNTPKRGWWVFQVDSSGRAYHIGYMVDNTHVIEARGRKYGVVKREWKKRDWDKWGIPKVWEGVIPAPGDPQPGTTPSQENGQQTTSGRPAEATFFLLIKVRGSKRRTVHVRKGPSTDFPVLFTAHGGDKFPLLAVSPSTGWYKIQTKEGVGYITNVTKYTDMEAAV